MIRLTPPPFYEEETLIRGQISAAREYCENYLGRALATQIIEWRGNYFPSAYCGYITLPMGPVQGIENIITVDEDLIETVIDPATYVVDSWVEPCQIAAVSTWPTLTPRAGQVRIRYVAGYTLPGDSPQEYPLPYSLRAAILLVFAHLYKNRENTTDLKLETLPLGAKELMNPYRLELGMA